VGPRAGLDDVKKRKFLTLPGIRTPTPRSSVASRYTDYAIPVPDKYDEELKFRRKWLWPLRVIISVFIWRDSEKPRKTSVRIVCIPIEIRTELLPYTEVQRVT
jgi:hypothetical protein